jgi:hypothetical protein
MKREFLIIFNIKHFRHLDFFLINLRLKEQNKLIINL